MAARQRCEDRAPGIGSDLELGPSSSVALIAAETALEEARSAGFDLDLIETNLALTPAERWKQHDAALELALALETARIARDAGLRKNSSAPG